MATLVDLALEDLLEGQQVVLLTLQVLWQTAFAISLLPRLLHLKCWNWAWRFLQPLHEDSLLGSEKLLGELHPVRRPVPQCSGVER